jgi:hypothetical protein
MAQMTVDPARLVFVGGLHRSGTTPLATAIAAHPEVSGLHDTGVKEDEGQHLQSVYPKAKLYGGAGRFALDPRSHLTEDSSLVTDQSAQRLVGEWSRYWDLDRRLLLEKSPPNLLMGRFLQALFPGAALVIVVRHPVVVALSTHKWRRLASRSVNMHTTHHQLVGHWMAAHDTFLRDLPHLTRTHVVRYEALVANPVAALESVADLLGLASPVPTDTLLASRSDRYARQWEAMKTGSPFQRWVRVKPGNRAVAVTPVPASSLARPSVNTVTKDLTAEYVPEVIWPATDETLTMAPCPRSRMARAAACDSTSTARPSTSKTASSSVMSLSRKRFLSA